MNVRDLMALQVLDEAAEWYRQEHGIIAIFDGTNSTASRRELLVNRCSSFGPDLILRPLFIEVLCNDLVGVYLIVDLLA